MTPLWLTLLLVGAGFLVGVAACIAIDGSWLWLRRKRRNTLEINLLDQDVVALDWGTVPDRWSVHEMPARRKTDPKDAA